MDHEKTTLLYFLATCFIWLHFGMKIDKYIEDEYGGWALCIILALPFGAFLYREDWASLISYGRAVFLSFGLGLLLRFVIALIKRRFSHGQHAP